MTPSKKKPSAASVDGDLIRTIANTVRGLAMDATRAADSGHPGMPLGMAEAAATLWLNFLRYNPANPHFADRDRFVLSAGHGSTLLYSLLHLAGFNVSLDDLRNFRQWGSPTPGHPEYGDTPGVEMTTGPLGQGFATGVGMALAAQMLEARFNTPERKLVDHWIYAIVSDGDLMEGVAAEAASFAGHHGLYRLIYLYDDNKISIEGSTDLTFSRENVTARFEALGWHVQEADGRDPQGISAAIAAAQQVLDRPHLIRVRTVIGWPSPKANTAEVHGSPLSADEIRATKEKMGWPADQTFHVPDKAVTAFARRRPELLQREKDWNALLERVRREEPEVAAAWDAHQKRPLPTTDADWETLLPSWKPGDKPIASRAASGQTINALAPKMPWLVGGSADLAPSNNTMIKGSESVASGRFAGRNIHFGVREHSMAAILNGMALHGGFRPYGGTFLVFADYMRPSIRLAALMKLPVIYVFTHDSIFLGEDGPTHQPVEHLAAMRAIPGLTVIRPADAAETAWAWATALRAADGPVALILSRQNLPHFNRAAAPDAKACAPARELARGAYVLSDSAGGRPEIILIASGSEAAIAQEAAETLRKEGRRARVVSMASWELFAAQPESYRSSVLPATCKRRLGVEAGASFGWERWIGEKGRMIAIDRYGASAPAKTLAEKFGFTAANVLQCARAMLKS